MIAFAVFLSVLILVWASILLFLKLKYGVDRVGWAAGGGPVDVPAMHEQNINRTRRKQRIIRNWRIQTVFMLAAISLPVLSFLLANRGLRPFIESLPEIFQVSNRVDSLAYMGLNVIERTSTHHLMLRQMVNNDLNLFCPSLRDLQGIEDDDIGFKNAQETIQISMERLDNFVQELSNEVMDTLKHVTLVTAGTRDAVGWLERNDWILRFLLLTMNTVNAFFLFAVFLTKNDFHYLALQAFNSYIMLPIFVVVLVGSIAATCGFATVAMANADFCIGGSYPGSPLGTFQEVIKGMGFSTSTQVYRSLDYYASECSIRSPLTYLDGMYSTTTAASSSLRQLIGSLAAGNNTMLAETCGGDFVWFNATLYEIERTLDNVRSNIALALDLTSCDRVSPILRTITFGSTCVESVEGLAMMFSMLLAITVSGMIMLTTRAALFNPLIRAKRKKRREKEFQEYKDYMAQFYDVTDWVLDPPYVQKASENLSSGSTESLEEDKWEDYATPSDISSSCEAESRRTSFELDNPQSVTSAKKPTPSAPIDHDKYHDDIEVIYYDSDSDSEDESNITYSIHSSISAFARHLWDSTSKIRHNRSSNAPDLSRDVDDDDEFDFDTDTHSDADKSFSSIGSLVSRFFRGLDARAGVGPSRTGDGDTSVQNPVVCTPYNPHYVSGRPHIDPLNLGYCQNTSMLSDGSVNSDSLDELPPKFGKRPLAPQKAVKRVPRTQGASLYFPRD